MTPKKKKAPGESPKRNTTTTEADRVAEIRKITGGAHLTTMEEDSEEQEEESEQEEEEHESADDSA